MFLFFMSFSFYYICWRRIWFFYDCLSIFLLLLYLLNFIFCQLRFFFIFYHWFLLNHRFRAFILFFFDNILLFYWSYNFHHFSWSTLWDQFINIFYLLFLRLFYFHYFSWCTLRDFSYYCLFLFLDWRFFNYFRRCTCWNILHYLFDSWFFRYKYFNNFSFCLSRFSDNTSFVLFCRWFLRNLCFYFVFYFLLLFLLLIISLWLLWIWLFYWVDWTFIGICLNPWLSRTFLRFDRT